MTPYVMLQREIIRILRRIAETDSSGLRDMVRRYRDDSSSSFLCDTELQVFKRYGFVEPTEDDRWSWRKSAAEIILEQVDDSGPIIVIRNLLGLKFRNIGPTYGFEGLMENKGSGSNLLRTSRLAQPRALQVGDVLADGSTVLSEPREGGNGSVLIHLAGGWDGHWVDVSGRIPIALLTPEDGAPEGLVDK